MLLCRYVIAQAALFEMSIQSLLREDDSNTSQIMDCDTRILCVTRSDGEHSMPHETISTTIEALLIDNEMPPTATGVLHPAQMTTNCHASSHQPYMSTKETSRGAVGERHVKDVVRRSIHSLLGKDTGPSEPLMNAGMTSR